MEIVQLGNSLAGLLSVVIALIALRCALKAGKRDETFDVAKHEREMAEMSLMVNTMWGAFISSGVTKGIAKGMVRMESPVRLVGNSAAMMEELKDDLQEFRNNECPNCNEQELSLKIAERFKEQIIKICSPNDIQFEVGVVIATAIAKGTHTLTDILNDYMPGGKPPPALPGCS